MYYSEPTRAQRLDILLHLTQYAHELLLVTGEEGSGKTTLLGQFLKKTKSNWKICRIDAFPRMHEDQILQRIYNGFGISLDDNPNVSTLTTLKRHIDAALVNIPTMVLIVDNVHVLPINVIGLLLDIANTRNLNSGKGLRTLFFCEPQIKILLASPELQDKQKQPQRKIDLPCFDENHTAQYLRHRLSQSGMVAERFLTDTTITKIHKQSLGLPGKINEAADKLLFDTTPLIRRTTNGKSRTTTPHNTPETDPASIDNHNDISDTPAKKSVARFKEHYVLAAVVTGLIIAILLFQDEINNLFHTQPHAKTLVVDNENKHTIKPLTLPNNDPVPPPKKDRIIQGTLPTTQHNNLNKTVHKSEPPPAVTSPTLSVPTPAIKLPTTSRYADRDNNRTTRLDHNISDDVDENNNVNNNLTIKSGTSRQPEDDDLPVAQGQSTTIPILSDTQSVAVIATTPPALDSQQSALGLKDDQWLLTQNPDHYTLQLVAGHHKSTVVKFIDQYKLTTPELSYFYSRRNGKNWHNLLHGVYADRTSAANAIASLPLPLTDIKPWIRSMESIQIDIYRAQQ